ncbi:MAG: hypothetical protein R3E66_09900 [bacterium]
MSTPSDIEDNYPEFWADRGGLNWDAFDRMTDDERADVRRVLFASADELDALDLATLTNCALWTYTSRVRQDLEAFSAATAMLLAREGLPDDPYLNFGEVLSIATYTLALGGVGDEAAILAQRYSDLFPDSPQRFQVRGWAMLPEKPEDAVALVLGVPDVEMWFEFVEDLKAFGCIPQALTLLDQVQTTSRADSPLRLDCLILREDLLNHE